MADFDGTIDPPAEWATVPDLSVTAVARGGPTGPMNAQAKTLTARTKFLADAKARDYPSVADSGATGGGDVTSILQAAFNTRLCQITAAVMLVSMPLKVLSMSALTGQRAGVAFTGSAANPKTVIKKTTNTTAAVTLFEAPYTVHNVDCILFNDPAWIDSGVSYPQHSRINNFALQGAIINGVPTFAGLYHLQGGHYDIGNMQITDCLHALYLEDMWSSQIHDIHTNGKIVQLGGTSCTYTNVGSSAGPSGSGLTGGQVFSSTTYSTVEGGWHDGTTITPYDLVNSIITFNGSGAEGCVPNEAKAGCYFTLRGGNSTVHNTPTYVPKNNQFEPIFSVGASNKAILNAGSFYSVATGVTSPDFQVTGNDSVVKANFTRFVNGSYDNAKVVFDVGVSTSRVEIDYGYNKKIYTSTGDGITVTETKFSNSLFTPVLQFINASTGLPGTGTITYGARSGKTVKTGDITTHSFRIAVTNKGPDSGLPTISGWSSQGPVNDSSLDISYITGITGGPIVGNIDGSGGASQVVLNLRTATGDTGATQANITNSFVMWGTITVQKAHT